jgi:hypothetical protein
MILKRLRTYSYSKRFDVLYIIFNKNDYIIENIRHMCVSIDSEYMKLETETNNHLFEEQIKKVKK